MAVWDPSPAVRAAVLDHLRAWGATALELVEGQAPNEPCDLLVVGHDGSGSPLLDDESRPRV